jgi:hypothetical protein
MGERKKSKEKISESGAIGKGNVQLSTLQYQLPTLQYQLPTLQYQLPTLQYQLPTLQ